MSAPTVEVTANFSYITGAPCPGAIVIVRLDRNDSYAAGTYGGTAFPGGVVVAQTFKVTADEDGIATFDAFPNNPQTGLGTSGSIYQIEAVTTAGTRFQCTAQFPDSDCNLQDVMDQDTDAGLSGGDTAVAAAQAYAAAAGSSASAASGYRTQTGLDRVQTGLDRTQTGLDRVQTGLDRVQTGLDRAAADASAQAAAATVASKQNSAITDAQGYFNTKTVEAALAQLAAKHGKTLYTSDIPTFDGTGATNMAALLSTAIAACAAANVRLHINSPIVKCTARVVTVDDARVSMEPGCYILRNFTTAGQTGFIGPNSSVATANRVWLWAIKVVSPDYDSYTGNIFDIHGDDCQLLFPIIKTYGAGRGIIVRGNNNVIYEPFIKDPKQVVGVGGIRVLQGNMFRCIGGNVDSGDDAFQFVPAALGAGDITRGQYIGCNGFSYAARLFVAALVDQDGSGGMTANIKDCSFIGIKGGSAVKAFVVENQDSSGVVDGIEIQNCTIDVSTSTSINAAEVTARTPDSNTYEVRNARIRGLAIKSPYQKVLKVSGGAVRGFSIDGLTAEKARSAGQPAVQVFGVTDGSMRNVDIWCNGAEGIQVGPNLSDPDNRCTNFVIDGDVKVRDVPDGKSAILFVQATECSIDGLNPVKAAGATTSIGVKLTASAINCLVGSRNVLSGVDVRVSDAGVHTAYLVRHFFATTDPTVTDDVSASALPGSLWVNSVRKVIKFCVDNATGAAVWVRRVMHPGIITGRYYPTIKGGSTANATGIAADITYAYPFNLPEVVTVAELAIRIGTTAGTGSGVKMAIYANSDSTGRAIGAPLISDSGGQATTTLSSKVGYAVSPAIALNPGTYWMMQKHSGTPPSVTGISIADFSVQDQIGRASINGNTALTAISKSGSGYAYADAWPTLAGSEVWTDETAAGVAIVSLKA
jgi:hypothetical protein